MAFTTSALVNSVFGNERVKVLRVTADAATDAFETGLAVIDAVSVGNQSASAGTAKFKINALSAGTAANGYLAVTGATSGDVYFVTVYGH